MLFYINLVIYFFIILFSFGLFLSNNPIFSIFYLILICVFISIYFLYLGAEFLALILIIIYVGAIAILFLFSIMMFNLRIISVYSSIRINYGLILSLFCLVILLSLFLLGFNEIVVWDYFSNSIELNLDYISNIHKFGDVLYGPLVHMVLLAATILLLALIGVISLIMDNNKMKGDTKDISNITKIKFYNIIDIDFSASRSNYQDIKNIKK